MTADQVETDANRGEAERVPEALSVLQADRRGNNDNRRWRLHYVTAREMYNMIKAAEAGHDGDPSGYRDFAITPPAELAQVFTDD